VHWRPDRLGRASSSHGPHDRGARAGHRHPARIQHGTDM